MWTIAFLTGTPGGDVANHLHPVYGRRVRVEHWDNALHQGPAAARSMLGSTPWTTGRCCSGNRCPAVPSETPCSAQRTIAERASNVSSAGSTRGIASG